MAIDSTKEHPNLTRVSQFRWEQGRLLVAVWLIVAPLLSVPASAQEAEVPEGAEVLESDRVDGIHRDLPAEISPIQQGAITIRLHSTNPVLEVANHQLLLWPLEGGTHGARLSAKFQGEAELQADLEIAGLPAQMSDFVELPEQETSIEGRFEIAREESGYRVVAEELPRFIAVRVKSRLAGQMVTLCRGL